MSTLTAEARDEFAITPLTEGFAASVEGVDLAGINDPSVSDSLRRLHLRYPVLAFPEQDLDPQSFLAFARLFGDIEIDTHVQQFAHPGLPELIYLTNVDKDGKPDPASAGRGSAWHSDSSYKADPCAHTTLYALEVPSRGGGTIFADMYRAYDTLPDDIQERIEGRKARHLFSRGPAAAGGFIPLTPEQEAELPQVEQPVVRIHPETGRKALYVNPLHTVEIIGLDPSESTEILSFLFDHAVRPEFLYHHHWQPRQLVIWDQRCTMHRGEAAYSMAERRRLMRAKISARAA
ncbi:MAG: TauD/TfdA family dioxygenase [Rickettsiales bacterium]